MLHGNPCYINFHSQSALRNNILFMQPSLACLYCTMIFDNSPPSQNSQTNPHKIYHFCISVKISFFIWLKYSFIALQSSLKYFVHAETFLLLHANYLFSLKRPHLWSRSKVSFQIKLDGQEKDDNKGINNPNLPQSTKDSKKPPMNLINYKSCLFSEINNNIGHCIFI